MPGPGIKAGTPIIGSRSSILPFCHNSPSFELEKAKEVVVCKRLAHTRPEVAVCESSHQVEISVPLARELH
jgi:hypothetical protein